MDLKWIAIFLVGVILLAGCAGNAGASANAGANGAANAGAGANDNGNSANANANAGANVNANTGNTAAQALGLMAMEALGVPTTCTVKTAGQKDTTLYIKGKNLRGESQMDQDNKTYTITSIITPDAMYVDTKSFGAQAAGCDWMEFKLNSSQTAGTTKRQEVSGGVDENALADLPATDFSCSPGVFGDEKFATPGKVCTFEDLMANALNNSGLNVNVTGSGSADAGSNSGMTAEQKAQVCASITDAQTRTYMGCS